MHKVRILVADDHQLIHNGISDILQNNEQFEIVGHAYSGKEAIELARKINPDIILMDISMPNGNGIEASRKLLAKNSEIRIIALSQHDEKQYVSQMLQVGCLGYLIKNSPKEEILTALDNVAKGKKYVNPSMIDLLMSKYSEKNIQQLTSRELEILKNIAEGKNNPEIANHLSISIRTVETHRRNLMQKLKVNTVVDLLKYAIKHKLIDL
jgi:DNA-binding NarL/FixJ family response regulator